MSEAIDTLQEIRAGFSLEANFGADLEVDEIVEGFVTVIGPRTTEDFACVMDGGIMTTRYEGLDGLREGWRDFLGGFETLAITPEEMWESPDGSCVVEFVRLRGRPKDVSAAIEEGAGAVWRLRDGKLAAVEFHMDRARALRAAGLAPDQ